MVFAYFAFTLAPQIYLSYFPLVQFGSGYVYGQVTGV